MGEALLYDTGKSFNHKRGIPYTTWYRTGHGQPTLYKASEQVQKICKNKTDAISL